MTPLTLIEPPKAVHTETVSVHMYGCSLRSIKLIRALNRFLPPRSTSDRCLELPLWNLVTFEKVKLFLIISVGVSEIFNVIQTVSSNRFRRVCEQKEFERAAGWPVGHLDDGNVTCEVISDSVYVRASLLATGLRYSYEMTLRIGMERCDCRTLS